jgi:chromosome partitioning protein
LIRARTLSHVQAELQKHGVRLLVSELNEREAFRALFSFGGVLEDLDPKNVPNVEKAVTNARVFCNEVLAILKETYIPAVEAAADGAAA